MDSYAKIMAMAKECQLLSDYLLFVDAKRMKIAPNKPFHA